MSDLLRDRNDAMSTLCIKFVNCSLHSGALTRVDLLLDPGGAAQIGDYLEALQCA